MKKKVFWGVVVGVLLVWFVCAGRYETSRKAEGMVVRNNGFVVVVKDDMGKEWKWNTDKRFEVGEKVVLVIDNKGTHNNPTDDTIRKVKRG